MSSSTDLILRLAGVHHLKRPVSDLDCSPEWHSSRLGYRAVQEFHEDGVLTGVVVEHPQGGPSFALRLDPDRARAAAGFDYFAIGVPDKAAIDELADWLTAHGSKHAGVHFATLGWILPMTHDPDGHEVQVLHRRAPHRDDVGPGPGRQRRGRD